MIKNYVFTYVYGNLRKFLSQLKIIGSTNRKSANRKSANRKIYMVRKSQICKLPHLRSVHKAKKIIPQVWEFAICGTYLRTAHLCLVLATRKMTT
jgi:hypothetical protein